MAARPPKLSSIFIHLCGILYLRAAFCARSSGALANSGGVILPTRALPAHLCDPLLYKLIYIYSLSSRSSKRAREREKANGYDFSNAFKLQEVGNNERHPLFMSPAFCFRSSPYNLKVTPESNEISRIRNEFTESRKKKKVQVDHYRLTR